MVPDHEMTNDFVKLFEFMLPCESSILFDSKTASYHQHIGNNKHEMISKYFRTQIYCCKTRQCDLFKIIQLNFQVAVCLAQSSIDEELFDVVSGFDALKDVQKLST